MVGSQTSLIIRSKDHWTIFPLSTRSIVRIGNVKLYPITAFHVSTSTNDKYFRTKCHAQHQWTTSPIRMQISLLKFCNPTRHLSLPLFVQMKGKEDIDSSREQVEDAPRFFSLRSHRFIICLLLLIANYFGFANTMAMSPMIWKVLVMFKIWRYGSSMHGELDTRCW